MPAGPGMAPKPSDSVEGLRAAGNQSFRNGQFAEAAALYSRALRALQAQGTALAPSTPGPAPGPPPRLPRPRPLLPPGAS